MITAPPIEKPCLERWDDMRGNNRTRLCEHCHLHVQNLSAMSRRDMARVLSPGQAEHACVTYVRGADGGLVTRATLLREQLIAPFGRAFSYLLKALVPVALALCRTPQKELFLGTWKVVERRRQAGKTDRMTFNEDHSCLLFTPGGAGHGKVDVRGSWYADKKNIYVWCEGKKYVWDIIDLLPDQLRLESKTRAVVYKRVGKTPFQLSNQPMPLPASSSPWS
jgi:hypothetical protein